MKKFKLFTTIASLCLAVALMAFGVYAATSATITFTSNIKYSVGTNIAGVLTVKSYQSTDGDTSKLDTTSGKEMEVFTATVNATMTDEEAGKLNAEEKEAKDSTFDANNKYVVYVIEFNESTTQGVTLQADDPVLKVSGKTEATTDIQVKANGIKTAVAAKTGESINKYYIVVHLEKALDADATFTVDFTINVAHSNA